MKTLRLTLVLFVVQGMFGCEPAPPQPRPAIGCVDSTRADIVYYLLQDSEFSGACVQDSK